MTLFGLPPNQFPHFYQGGRRIEALRGLPPRAANMPEDWVGSTTTRFGQADQGLSRLPDGRILRDAVEADPVHWLGVEHVSRYGTDLGVLVKLLDAGQRLVVHVHPDQQFAAAHLHCAHGKTEAWIVVETEQPHGLVYLGFTEDVDADTVADWVAGQRTDAMLAALNAVPVRAGDAVFVPAGLPHAIGAGILIVELQEPTDFSVLLEWQGFDLDGPREGHLGLGFDLALQCLNRGAVGQEQLAGLRGPAADGSTRARLLPTAADRFFRAELVREGAELEASVAVLVVTDGEGRLTADSGDELELHRGDTVVVAHAAGRTRLSGPVQVIRCQPPAPTAALS